MHYEAVVKSIELTSDEMERSYWDAHEWGFDSQGHRQIPQNALDEGFTEHKRICNEQYRTQQKAESLLSEVPRSMFNLEGITVGYATNILDNGDAMHIKSSFIPGVARKILIPYACEGWADRRLSPEYVTLFIRAIASSQRVVRKVAFSSGDYKGVNTDFLVFSDHTMRLASTLPNIWRIFPYCSLNRQPNMRLPFTKTWLATTS